MRQGKKRQGKKEEQELYLVEYVFPDAAHEEEVRHFATGEDDEDEDEDDADVDEGLQAWGSKSKYAQ